MITYGDMIAFVLSYRGHSKAFYEYTPEQIFEHLRSVATVGGLCYVQEQGQLIGVVTAVPNSATKQLKITNILTRNRQAIGVMVSEFTARFPDFKLTALRKGKQISYNTPRLCRLLTSISR